MNKKLLVLSLVILLSLFSCQKEKKFPGETTNFGTVEYYNPFLFKSCDTLTLNKNLKYNFNTYSVETKSYVTIKVVDTAQNIISDKNILFYINDKLIEDNSFTLYSKESNSGNLKVGLKFLPNYPDGYTTGFLNVFKHNIDVINNNDLKSSSEKRLFKWEATHRLIMNPLKKMLMWFGIFLLTAFLIWFMILRNKIYSKFKRGKIQIVSPYFKGVSITKNTRLVVFTNSAIKQKFLNKLFTGKIIYEVNPIYEKDITLRPGRNNKIKIKLPLGAKITPMVINLEKFNNYKIQINQEKIEIQYS